MNALLDIAEQWLRRAANAAAVLGGLAMLAMLVVVAANIVLRPFGETVRGAVELSGYLCALAVGLCMPAAQAAGSHIAAGVWAAPFPRAGRSLHKALSSLICAALLFPVALELSAIAAYARDMGEYIEGFTFSAYGLTMGAAAGILLHAAMFAHAFCRALFPAPRATGGPA